MDRSNYILKFLGSIFKISVLGLCIDSTSKHYIYGNHKNNVFFLTLALEIRLEHHNVMEKEVRLTIFRVWHTMNHSPNTYVRMVNKLLRLIFSDSMLGMESSSDIMCIQSMVIAFFWTSFQNKKEWKYNENILTQADMCLQIVGRTKTEQSVGSGIFACSSKENTYYKYRKSIFG